MSSQAGRIGARIQQSMRALIQWLLTPWLLPTRPLSGKALLAAKVIAATIVGACLVMFAISLPARYAWLEQLATQAHPILRLNTQLNPRLSNLVVQYFPQIALGIEVGVMLLYCMNAALLFWKRSHDWLALLTAGALPAFALHIIPTLYTWMELNPFNTLVGSIFKCVGLGLAFLFLFLFPNGFYAPAWIRLFFWGWIVWAAAWLLFPTSAIAFRDPYTISIPGFILLMAWWTIGIYSQIYRYYRVSGPLQRQQTKTITFGATVVFMGYIFYVPLREAMLLTSKPLAASILFQMVAPYIYLFMVASIPVLIARSILRFRLWDIDLVIRRTLVYSLLTLLLGLVYFTAVTLLQSLVSSVSHQESAISIVLSTLAIAALFTPLRRRLQHAVDRRFFRQRYDAEKALEEFATAARSESDLEQLTAHLMATVQETLQPKAVTLWFKKDSAQVTRRETKENPL
jgi:hypothetical protein